MRAAPLLLLALVPVTAAAIVLRVRAIETHTAERRARATSLARLPIPFPPPGPPFAPRFDTVPPAPPGTMILRHRGPNGVTIDTIPVLGARPSADDPRAIPVPFGVPDTLPAIECPMAVQLADTSRFPRMPVARPDVAGAYRMPIVRPKCRNPLGH